MQHLPQGIHFSRRSERAHVGAQEGRGEAAYL